MIDNTDQLTSSNTKKDFVTTFTKLGYGEVHIKQDERCGMFAIIAIHNTNRGPSLGGCRFIPYSSKELAIVDALRLAQGMSYKASISNLPFGGGKAVIINNSGIKDRALLFRKFGEFVQSLSGRYITAEDSGTTVADMDEIKQNTNYVTGHSKQDFSHKDPSPLTALGVRRGIEAAVKHKIKQDNLEGIHIAIQGVGSVGYHLAKQCHKLGAKLTICDINQDAVNRCQQEFSAAVVEPDIIHTIECDVFAPCALSNAINSKTITHLRTKIVAGAANNQLSRDVLADELKKRDILYAPDYAINAGGLIHVAAQYKESSEAEAKKTVEQIYDTMDTIFTEAEQSEASTLTIANQIAEQRLK